MGKKAIMFLMAFLPAVVFLASCHEEKDYPTDIYGTFDCIADLVETRYCFLDDKGADWPEIRTRYRQCLVEGITSEEFFNVCADMLGELRDGHVNLVSGFDVSYYQAWWTDYPQDFNLRTLQQYYLGFDYKTTCGIYYKIMPNNVGYLYYPSFSYTVGEGNLDYILSWLGECNALIIDIRNNGGGDMENIRTFVGRFIHHTVTGGYLSHKTGPGPDDFAEPYAIEYSPCAEGHVVWDKPIALLTNRSCFSAANDFTAVMRTLPNVTVIGARTGGGGGFPFTFTLPNGWKLRLSTARIYDRYMKSIESGIDPSAGFEVHSPEAELAAGRDAILDRALEYLGGQPLDQQ